MLLGFSKMYILYIINTSVLCKSIVLSKDKALFEATTILLFASDFRFSKVMYASYDFLMMWLEIIYLKCVY